MSDRNPQWVKNSLDDWRPLDPQKLERFHTNPVFTPEAMDSDVGETFRLLHDQEPRPAADEAFELIYQRETKESTSIESKSPECKGVPVPPATTDARLVPEPADPVAQQAAANAALAEKAYKEAYARGEKDGYAEGLRKSVEQLRPLQSMLKELDGVWDKMIKTYEKEIIELVCRVAEKVVLAKVESDPESVRRSILHAFELIPEPTNVVIQLHPEDYEFVELIKDDIFETIKGLKNVEVNSNPSISRGGCVVETRSGNVSIDIEERLAQVKQSLIEINRLKG